MSKYVLTFTIITCLSGLLATMASANFFAPNKFYKVKKAGIEETFTLNGDTFKCLKKDMEGKIRKADGLQEEVTKGGHANMEFKYGECKTQGGLAVTVPAFSQQAEQGAGKATAQVKYLTEENIKVPAIECEIKIPASKENENLKLMTFTDLKKMETELESEFKAELSGITLTASAGCSALEIKSGKEDTEKEREIETGMITE